MQQPASRLLRMQQDRFGQSLSTHSAIAAKAYSNAIDALFALQLGSGALIDAALEEDPEFALAHSVKARSLFFEGMNREAVRSAERGQALAANATRRERQHAEIVLLVTKNESAQALKMVLEHAREHPRDALPLSFALGVYGLLGFGGFIDYHQQQHELLESLADAWDEDWWFLTSLGWSYVETGKCEIGIEMLDRALEINHDNAQAAHARSHGYYETGAAEEGAAFLADWLPTYDRGAPLHGHLAWHHALFFLQTGDCASALDVYRKSIAPRVSQALPMFTMVDSASFLWRCRLHGQPVEAAEYAELSEFTRSHFPNAGLPFVSLHAALVFAGAGDAAALTGVEDGVAELLAADEQVCGRVIGDLCSGLSAYNKLSFKEAASMLSGAMRQLERLGGSHAQRDVVIDTLVSALLRSGDTATAREVMKSRATTRAHHLDEAWFERLVR